MTKFMKTNFLFSCYLSLFLQDFYSFRNAALHRLYNNPIHFQMYKVTVLVYYTTFLYNRLDSQVNFTNAPCKNPNSIIKFVICDKQRPHFRISSLSTLLILYFVNTNGFLVSIYYSSSEIERKNWCRGRDSIRSRRYNS